MRDLSNNTNNYTLADIVDLLAQMTAGGTPPAVAAPAPAPAPNPAPPATPMPPATPPVPTPPPSTIPLPVLRWVVSAGRRLRQLQVVVGDILFTHT